MSNKAFSSQGHKLELETFLPYRLNVLADEVSRALSGIYADKYGISVPEWRIIATLGQYRQMTAKAMGEHTHMHKTKVSRAVAQLQHKGFVERTKNDRDRREVFVTLTARGKNVYHELVPEALKFTSNLVAQLPRAELEQFERTVQKLTRLALEKKE